MNIGNTVYEVGSYRIYDLINPDTFPALRTARSASDRVWKSMIIDRYVRSVFNLLPSGSLENQNALYVWNFLIQSAFGMGNEAYLLLIVPNNSLHKANPYFLIHCFPTSLIFANAILLNGAFEKSVITPFVVPCNVLSLSFLSIYLKCSL